MLKKRLMTAAILIPAMLGIIFYLPVVVFAYITSLISLAAAWEWTNLMSLRRPIYRVLYLLLMMAALFNAMLVPIQFILMVAFAWWTLALFLVVCYPRLSSAWAKSKITRALMGFFVIVPCWGSLLFIRAQPDGVYAMVFLFILIWGADSVAYFAGRFFGRHKLAPAVSPGKSIEGAIGAFIFAILFALLALWWSQMPAAGWPWAVALSLLTVAFSIVGDLFESMLKRNVNLKDSGQLLPGHGGILDRIDSLTAAAPVFTLGALLLGAYL